MDLSLNALDWVPCYDQAVAGPVALRNISSWGVAPVNVVADPGDARPLWQSRPHKTEYCVGHFELAGEMQPCQLVGGDFFDFMEFGDGSLGFALADVVGKGFPAALLAARLQALLKAFASPSPAETVRAMNRLFAASAPGQRFASLFYAVLRPDGRAVYTNAGHNPPLVVSLSGIRRLGTGGTVVGLFPDASYEQEEVELESGDLIALFSDGVYEATSPDGSEFGEGRLVEILAPSQQQRCVEIRDRVLHDAHSFTGGSLADDATALLVRYLGA